MATVVVFPPEVERVLALKTLRGPDALGHLQGALRDSSRDDLEFTQERLRELTALGEHFQALLLYDQVDFLRAGMLDERDHAFASSIQRAYLEAANGYQRFLRARESWASTADAREDAQRLVGLALDAIHGFMKWGYFLGEPARGAPWRQLHALYALAQADAAARKGFVLHPAQPAFTPSVESLYLRTLVLDLLNAGNLSRAQIEIADGWFSSWCQDYALEAEFVPGRHHFYVDLEAAAGMRLLRGDSPAQSTRYLQAEAIKAQIEEVQQGLRQGRLFAGYGAGALFPVEEHAALLATLEKLHQSVLSGNEARVEERTHFEDREVDVVVGAECVMRKVRAGAPATSPGSLTTHEATQTFEITPAGLSLTPDAQAASAAAETDPEIQRWRVHDLSSRGYGLIVDHDAAQALVLGDLIALLNHETGGWILGSIVRKRPSRVRGEVLAGVEVLSYSPIALDLVPADGGAAMAALYIPGGDSSGKHDSLLVRGNTFESRRALALRTPEGEFRLRLNRIIRKGADWINARFEIESKKG